METPEKKLARKVMTRDGYWSMKGCLIDAIICVAPKEGYNDIDNLDDKHTPINAVRVLASLCCHGLSKVEGISKSINIEIDKVSACLGSLCEFEFAEECGQNYQTEYQATPKGVRIIHEIGIETLKMDFYRMGGDLHSAEKLFNELDIPRPIFKF
ncbi:hypothetical protein SAMN02746065_10913 [Desulfocicer vacuolatum DSM 3385]|uniref:Uncharacterized protein n=1 Tax=Desulfocicer vacuolatum DSM 3385 TaxID=1121400 RepID=A0A1W2BNP5_9BACT|nr:hypothetical protein [Desulfocicer vacuolatum]SMC74565.1 hypothetical protein SAMN02746065_10913 [Desulfocicer vacuolatum DSM 3385]